MPRSIPPSQDPLEQRLAEVFARHEKGELEKAETLYRELIAEQPAIWQLFFNLGALCFAQQRYEDALHYYFEGLEIEADSSDLLYNTAICLKELERYDEAIEMYTRVLDQDPDDRDSRYNLAGAQRAAGRSGEAIRTYAHLLASEPDHLPSLINMAYLHHERGDTAAARVFYRRILALEPGHVTADHMLAAIDGQPRSTAPAGYVRDIFDQFADHYETSLTEALRYRLPSTLSAFYRQNFPDRPVSALLDLSCGTGLVGECFADVCGSMTGVDLSPQMIAAAHEKDVYDSLVVSDILDFLDHGRLRSYDLVVSADVFPYIGDVGTIFRALAGSVTAGCCFIFSVEHLDSDDRQFRLQSSGRFAHSRGYLVETAKASGWRVCAEKMVDLRMERGQWIKGGVFLALRVPG